MSPLVWSAGSVGPEVAGGGWGDGGGGGGVWGERRAGRSACVLPPGPVGEVAASAVVPAERVASVGAAPAEQLRAPRDGAVHERALRFVPHAVGRHRERGRRRVDKRVGRVYQDLLRHLAAAALRCFADRR